MCFNIYTGQKYRMFRYMTFTYFTYLKFFFKLVEKFKPDQRRRKKETKNNQVCLSRKPDLLWIIILVYILRKTVLCELDEYTQTHLYNLEQRQRTPISMYPLCKTFYLEQTDKDEVETQIHSLIYTILKYERLCLCVTSCYLIDNC